MKRHLPPLLALRAFESAARHASFLRTAEEIHVTQGAISRHVKNLETFLGQPRFRRLTRRVELTAFGKAYYVDISAGLNQIERATVSALSPKTTLNVSIIPSTANLWLMPRIASFTEAHGDIELDVATSVQPARFDSDAIDVAIRLGPLPGQRYRPRQPAVPHEMVTSWRGIAAQRLCDEVLVPVCSRKLLREGPPLKSPADLAQHTLIHVAGRNSAWADWLRAVGHPGVIGKSSLEFGHFFMALEAARKHRGGAIASTLHIESVEWRHELATPFPARVKSAGGYYLLYREKDADLRKIKVFRKWLLSQVKAMQLG